MQREVTSVVRFSPQIAYSCARQIEQFAVMSATVTAGVGPILSIVVKRAIDKELISDLEEICDGTASRDFGLLAAEFRKRLAERVEYYLAHRDQLHVAFRAHTEGNPKLYYDTLNLNVSAWTEIVLARNRIH